MHEESIALQCPYCGDTIYEKLNWFKKAYSTCPACDRGLSADQFATVIADFEEAVDAHIDEMMAPAPSGGCGCKSSCC